MVKIGRLAGIVNNICYRNHGISASSRILENYIYLHSATVVAHLFAEDAIIIGRLNCDKSVMGVSNGSAVSVQVILCFASLATTHITESASVNS